MNVLERMQATVAENRGTILLLVGLFLLLNPQLTAGLVETDTDQYGYESFQIALTEDGTIEAPEKIVSIDTGAACLEIPITRPCVLEQAVYADSGIVYDGPSAFIERSYSYVYVHDEGFFEPVERERSDGRVHYGHEPVDASTAIDRISTPIDRASEGARAAIEQGTVDTTDEIREITDGHLDNGTVNWDDQVEPVMMSPRTAAARAFRAAIRKRGGEPHLLRTTGTSDMNVYAKAWDCPMVTYGPGDSDLDHAPNEHLPLEEYDHAVAVLKDATQTLLEE